MEKSTDAKFAPDLRQLANKHNSKLVNDKIAGLRNKLVKNKGYYLSLANHTVIEKGWSDHQCQILRKVSEEILSDPNLKNDPVFKNFLFRYQQPIFTGFFDPTCTITLGW